MKGRGKKVGLCEVGGEQGRGGDYRDAYKATRNGPKLAVTTAKPTAF